jgi:hypothetical protein
LQGRSNSGCHKAKMSRLSHPSKSRRQGSRPWRCFRSSPKRQQAGALHTARCSPSALGRLMECGGSPPP